MTQTADQSAAEKIARAIDGQIFRLNEERATLLQAATRIAEIDAELLVLAAEKARIDPRRPPKPVRPEFNVTIVPLSENKP